jgi:hypothetical protein
MGINHENVKCDLKTVSTDHFEGGGSMQVPLALPDGKVHVLKALITNKSLGQVDTHPPPNVVAEMLDVPENDLATRTGGAMDIMMGQDNSHLFPRALGAPKTPGLNLQLFRAILGNGLMYAGSTGPGWNGSKQKVVARRSLLTFGLILLSGLCVLSPADGFIAYDCTNASNIVEAYSLLEPEECHATGGEHKVERVVQGEVLQIKKERTISIFRCQVLETVVSQYCYKEL